MLLLFQAIKERSPSTEIQVLMSDDDNIISDDNYLHNIHYCHFIPDNIYVNAAKRIFGEGIKHLLCRWHVDQ